MFNLNLVHGGLRKYSGEKMNGHQINSFLAQNHHDYKDTKLCMVPNVHPSIIAMMELLVEQIADYLRLSTEEVLSSLTLGEFCRFWGHIVGTKAYTDGLGLWGEEFINENIRLHGDEMAKYLGIELDQLQNISNRDFSRWLGHWYGLGSKKWRDARLQVNELRLQGEEPSQEELKANRVLRCVWDRDSCWDLIRAGDKPTQEQLKDPNFAAAWRGVDRTIAAARLRVKKLRDKCELPNQEEFDGSLALRRAWNDAICWDLIRAEEEPTQEQLDDPEFAAAWPPTYSYQMQPYPQIQQGNPFAMAPTYSYQMQPYPQIQQGNPFAMAPMFGVEKDIEESTEAEDLSSLTVVQLQDKLRKAGLRTCGLYKADLIERLRQHYEES